MLVVIGLFSLVLVLGEVIAMHEGHRSGMYPKGTMIIYFSIACQTQGSYMGWSATMAIKRSIGGPNDIGRLERLEIVID